VNVNTQIFERIMIPMRDGVSLAADLFLPDGGPWPALLARGPYGFPPPKDDDAARERASWGYAVINQDVRGRGRSEGRMKREMEGQDGYDTIGWIAEQPWCNGRVGTRGPSYLGAVQFAAARLHPPGLACLFAPLTGTYWRTLTRSQNGAFLQSRAQNWLLRHGAIQDPEIRQNKEVLERLERAAEALPEVVNPTSGDPISTAYAVLDGLLEVPPWADFFPLRDWPVLRGAGGAFESWAAAFDLQDHQTVEPTKDDPARIEVPVFLVAGWYDVFLQGSLANYRALVANAPDERTAASHRLVIAPLGHGWSSEPFCGEIPVAAEGKLDFADIERRYFAQRLHRIDPPLDDEAPVRYYTFGSEVWHTSSTWPPNGIDYTRLYFHGPEDPDAPRSNSAGRLRLQRPAWNPPFRYLYDPGKPVPTRGGDTLWLPWGGYDQRPVSGEARSDVLSFTGESLIEQLEVTGPVQVVLYAASSASDTDFTAKLIDIHPDGRMLNVRDGIVRARYRQGSSSPTSPLQRGHVYRFEIDLVATSYLFRPGHRFRVDISSSNFPQFDRNPNTGNPIGTDRRSDLVTAEQTIFHDALRPSHVLLPLMRRS
jgi:putative CocE/NonD family hydrolase